MHATFKMPIAIAVATSYRNMSTCLFWSRRSYDTGLTAFLQRRQ